MRVILFVAMLLSTLSPLVSAQELVVGFVNIPLLIEKSPQSIEAGKRLEKEFAPRQKKLQEDRAKLDAMKAKLQKESLVMTATERSELELSIRQLDKDFKRNEQDFREELNIKKNNEFKKVRKLMVEAVLKFANTGEYDLILSEGVMFAHKRIDITSKIATTMSEIGKTE